MTAECVTCGRVRRITARKMCDACYTRDLHARNPEFAARRLAAQREVKLRLKVDPEWVELERARDRVRGARKRGEEVIGLPRPRMEGPCMICRAEPAVAKNMCRRCYQREYMRRRRRENHAAAARDAARSAALVKRNGEAVRKAKKRPCVDCGSSFPLECMDFDHIDERGPKLFALGKAGCRSLEAVLAEIAKCDVVCANCHRIRTRARARGRPGMH